MMVLTVIVAKIDVVWRGGDVTTRMTPWAFVMWRGEQQTVVGVKNDVVMATRVMRETIERLLSKQ